jgi:hypothetical protein
MAEGAYRGVIAGKGARVKFCDRSHSAIPASLQNPLWPLYQNPRWSAVIRAGDNARIMNT